MKKDFKKITNEALSEATERHKNKKQTNKTKVKVKEVGGPEGPEPTRYGDWEKKGIVYDF